jgi:hypothetical protein
VALPCNLHDAAAVQPMYSCTCASLGMLFSAVTCRSEPLLCRGLPALLLGMLCKSSWSLDPAVIRDVGFLKLVHLA